MGVELFEKTLGIFGLGRIGSNVAERARAFQMKILGYDPFITQERAKLLGVELVEMVIYYAVRLYHPTHSGAGGRFTSIGKRTVRPNETWGSHCKLRPRIFDR
ncbi:MAG: hypothetical protein CM1200mP16_07990 [Nitrospina sp.]|nr:MAG: hypothetical protein CM1200mP16_07990 [Nitrospina sp.]